MQLYKIHTFFVVASSLEQAKEAVKDKLPATYFSESICPVDIVAVEQPLALDVCPRCEGAGRYSDIIGLRYCLLCDGTGKRK